MTHFWLIGFVLMMASVGCSPTKKDSRTNPTPPATSAEEQSPPPPAETQGALPEGNTPDDASSEDDETPTVAPAQPEAGHGAAPGSQPSPVAGVPGETSPAVPGEMPGQTTEETSDARPQPKGPVSEHEREVMPAPIVAPAPNEVEAVRVESVFGVSLNDDLVVKWNMFKPGVSTERRKIPLGEKVNHRVVVVVRDRTGHLQDVRASKPVNLDQLITHEENRSRNAALDGYLIPSGSELRVPGAALLHALPSEVFKWPYIDAKVFRDYAQRTGLSIAVGLIDELEGEDAPRPRVVAFREIPWFELTRAPRELDVSDRESGAAAAVEVLIRGDRPGTENEEDFLGFSLNDRLVLNWSTLRIKSGVDYLSDDSEVYFRANVFHRDPSTARETDVVHQLWLSPMLVIGDGALREQRYASSVSGLRIFGAIVELLRDDRETVSARTLQERLSQTGPKLRLLVQETDGTTGDRYRARPLVDDMVLGSEVLSLTEIPRDGSAIEKVIASDTVFSRVESYWLTEQALKAFGDRAGIPFDHELVFQWKSVNSGSCSDGFLAGDPDLYIDFGLVAYSDRVNNVSYLSAWGEYAPYPNYNDALRYGHSRFKDYTVNCKTEIKGEPDRTLHPLDLSARILQGLPDSARTLEGDALNRWISELGPKLRVTLFEEDSDDDFHGNTDLGSTFLTLRDVRFSENGSLHQVHGQDGTSAEFKLFWRPLVREGTLSRQALSDYLSEFSPRPLFTALASESLWGRQLKGKLTHSENAQIEFTALLASDGSVQYSELGENAWSGPATFEFKGGWLTIQVDRQEGVLQLALWLGNAVLETLAGSEGYAVENAQLQLSTAVTVSAKGTIGLVPTP